MRWLKKSLKPKNIKNLLHMIFNINHIHFKVVRRRTETTHQQRVSPSGSLVIKRAFGESPVSSFPNI